MPRPPSRPKRSPDLFHHSTTGREIMMYMCNVLVESRQVLTWDQAREIKAADIKVTIAGHDYPFEEYVTTMEEAYNGIFERAVTEKVRELMGAPALQKIVNKMERLKSNMDHNLDELDRNLREQLSEINPDLWWESSSDSC